MPEKAVTSPKIANVCGSSGSWKETIAVIALECSSKNGREEKRLKC